MQTIREFVAVLWHKWTFLSNPRQPGAAASLSERSDHDHRHRYDESDER